jgi:hypothetical protein
VPTALSPCHARELWTSKGGTPLLSLDTSLKASLVVQHGQLGLGSNPESTASTSLWRGRLTFSGDIMACCANWQFAYEQRSRVPGNGRQQGVEGILPNSTRPPLRLSPLDWALASEPTLEQRHEIDRAFIMLHGPNWQITAGRQAIGWGRGVLFQAVDVFSPFLPTEVDREWRRGVDALRAEVSPVPELTMEAAAAFGPTVASGAYLGQVVLRSGDVEVGFIGGLRTNDIMAAALGSASLLGAEVHAEVAGFHSRGSDVSHICSGAPQAGSPAPAALATCLLEPDSPALVDPLTAGESELAGRWIVKAVAGGSRAFDIGRTLTLSAEYHYSGFGLSPISPSALLSADPEWGRRLQRGDFQIMGRHVLGASVSCDVLDELLATVTVLQSPTDGSGLLYPALTYYHSGSVTLVASVFGSWGSRSVAGLATSEYGSFPTTVFLQVRLND